ncbi:MAG TPA: hypothetical protein PKN36_04480 [bacterium]|nr:hypothetical protein [bacterium]
MDKKFPRTEVGGISLPRMIIGTNWFLGYSHCTKAKSLYIQNNVRSRNKISEILEVFFSYGINAVMGRASTEKPLAEAIRQAEDKTGTKAIIISTPSFPVSPVTPEEGFENGQTRKILDEEAASGTAICLPHQCTTDAMIDRCTRKIRKFDGLVKLIRERKMVPGLSTHMPEGIVFADESALDIETYISIYNALGFLMQVEVDWISKVINNAQKPVMVIKPMAAGHIRPFQALTFVWNTIRDRDMVAVGTMSPDEAKELVELSLAILEKRKAGVELQRTRSKSVLE